MMTQEQINVDLFDQVDTLQREVRELEQWKKEALLVLGEWDRVWEAAGKPGRLGASKAVSVREFLEQNANLKQELANEKRDYHALASHHNEHCTCLEIY